MLAERPINVSQASVRSTALAWMLTSTSTSRHRHDPHEFAQWPYFETIAFREPSVAWFQNALRASDRTSSLLHHLQNGTAIDVSDGSYFPDESIGAVSTPNTSEWIEGGDTVENDIHSYRTELTGKIAIAACLEGIHLGDLNLRPDI